MPSSMNFLPYILVSRLSVVDTLRRAPPGIHLCERFEFPHVLIAVQGCSAYNQSFQTVWCPGLNVGRGAYRTVVSLSSSEAAMPACIDERGECQNNRPGYG